MEDRIKMMKKLLIPLLAFCALSTSADVYYNDNYYLSCDSCTINADFVNLATDHFEENYPQNSPNGPEAEHVYIVTNLNTAVFKTVRVKREVVIVTGYGGMEYPTYEQTSTLEANSFYNNHLFDEYIENKSAFDANFDFEIYQGSKKSISGIWNEWYFEQSELNNNISFQNTSNFETAVENVINDVLSETYYNPFHFIKTPMAVSFLTTDNYRVLVIAEGPVYEDFKWKLVYAHKNDSFYDLNNNLMNETNTLPSNSVCIASSFGEVCREVMSDNQPLGSIFYRAVELDKGNESRGIPHAPPPTGCSRNNENCNSVE